MQNHIWNIFTILSADTNTKYWKWENHTNLKKKILASLIEGLVIPKEMTIVAPPIENMEPAITDTPRSQDIIKTIRITMWTLMMRTPIYKAPLWFHWVDWPINSYEIPSSEKAIRLIHDDWKILAWLRLLPTGANSAVIKEMHLTMSPTAIAWIMNIIWDPKKIHISIGGELYIQIMDYLRELISWVMTDYRIEFPCR